MRDRFNFAQADAAAAPLDRMDDPEDVVERLGVALALLQGQHFAVENVQAFEALDEQVFDKLLLQVVVHFKFVG